MTPRTAQQRASARAEMHRREAVRRGHPAWLFVCGVFLGMAISFLMGIRA